MIKLILCLLFSITAFATPEEAKKLLEKFEGHDRTPTRLELFSREFLGLPYGAGGPLGEGELGRYDQDPLYRFDTFDCTTYVETIVSLALTRDVRSFEEMMDKIRYEDGQVDYLKRNHFPSLQWIPLNVENGLLSEINHLILPIKEQKVAEALINLPGWLKAIKLEEIKVPLATLEQRQLLLEELRSQHTNFSPIIARLNYLPISTLVERPSLLNRIPHGSIINFVRPNWDLTDVIGTHMNVSHQGFVFRKKEGVFLRHASTTGKVKEELLLDYLKKFENHPTMKGIHLMKVN
jgi:hypothetical protein